MAGILYVVATPIGNLEDVTLRALRILRDVSLIAAEDTRRTARLLQHYSISTRTTSLHEHNERDKAPKLVERLRGGESIALVSDAGTPLISDPGQTLVAAARTAGIRVEAIPGASAVMAVLSASGLPVSEFTFLGFPPNRSKDRNLWFERLPTLPGAAVLFEAPHRFGDMTEQLARVLGGDSIVLVGRELTKAHEELVFCPINELALRFSAPKGEFTVVIPARDKPDRSPLPLPDEESLRVELGQLAENEGAHGRQALKLLAARYGRTVNELYRILGTTRAAGSKDLISKNARRS